MARDRDYRKEYDTYHAKPEQRRANDARKKARRQLVKEGAVRPGDGKEVDHKDGNPMNGSRKNLQVLSRKKNREKGG